MNTEPFGKPQMREVRRLAGLAYERELGAAAAALQREFERWNRGEIDVFTLTDEIHKFHQGIARDLYKRYAMGEPVWNVASAMHRGVLAESEVGSDLRGLLQEQIEAVRKIEALNRLPASDGSP